MELDSLVIRLALRAQELEDELDDLRNGMNDLNGSTSRVQSGFDTLKSVAGYLAAGLAAIGVKNLAKDFIEAADQSEQLKLRLEVMLGSVQQGSKLFDDMAKYAQKVPFEYKDIMASATQLAGIMKGGVSEINKWMPLIGDLAATSGLTIGQTTDQIARMYSAGAASADLFQERGINAMLGFKAGVSVSVEETRKRLMEEWEKQDSSFRGATDKLATTWSGLMSNFQDIWFDFENKTMDTGLFIFLKENTTEVLNVLKKWQTEGDLTAWARLLAVSVISAFEGIIGATAAIHEVWLSLKSTGLLVFDALVGYINNFLQYLIKSQDSISSVIDALVEMGWLAKNPIKSLQEGFQKITESSEIATKETLKGQKDTTDGYIKIFEKLENYKEKIFEVKNVHYDLKKAITKTQKEITQETEAELKKRKADEKKMHEEGKRFLDKYYENTQKSQIASIDSSLRELSREKDEQLKIKNEIMKELGGADVKYLEEIKQKYRDQAFAYTQALRDDPDSILKTSEWLDAKLRKADEDFLKNKIKTYEDMYKGAGGLKALDNEYWSLREEQLIDQAAKFGQMTGSNKSAEEAFSKGVRDLSIERQKLIVDNIADELKQYGDMSKNKSLASTDYWTARETQINAEHDLYVTKTGDMTTADNTRTLAFKRLENEKAIASDSFFNGMKAAFSATELQGKTWSSNVSAYVAYPAEEGEKKWIKEGSFLYKLSLDLLSFYKKDGGFFRTFGEAGAEAFDLIAGKGGSLFKATASDSIVGLLKGDMDAFAITWDAYWEDLGARLIKKVADWAAQLIADKSLKYVLGFVSDISGISLGASSGGSDGGIGKTIGSTVIGKGAETVVDYGLGALGIDAGTGGLGAGTGATLGGLETGATLGGLGTGTTLGGLGTGTTLGGLGTGATLGGLEGGLGTGWTLGVPATEAAGSGVGAGAGAGASVSSLSAGLVAAWVAFIGGNIYSELTKGQTALERVDPADWDKLYALSDLYKNSLTTDLELSRWIESLSINRNSAAMGYRNLTEKEQYGMLYAIDEIWEIINDNFLKEDRQISKTSLDDLLVMSDEQRAAIGLPDMLKRSPVLAEAVDAFEQAKAITQIIAEMQEIKPRGRDTSEKSNLEIPINDYIVQNPDSALAEYNADKLKKMYPGFFYLNIEGYKNNRDMMLDNASVMIADYISMNTKMHSGGRLDLKTDEGFFIGQKGEEVINAPNIRALDRIVSQAKTISPQTSSLLSEKAFGDFRGALMPIIGNISEFGLITSKVLEVIYKKYEDNSKNNDKVFNSIIDTLISMSANDSKYYQYSSIQLANQTISCNQTAVLTAQGNANFSAYAASDTALQSAISMILMQIKAIALQSQQYVIDQMRQVAFDGANAILSKNNSEYPNLPLTFDIGGKLGLTNEHGLFVGKTGEEVVSEANLEILQALIDSVKSIVGKTPETTQTRPNVNVKINIGEKEIKDFVMAVADDMRYKADKRGMSGRRVIF